MYTVVIKDVYPATQISYNNKDAWEVILNQVEKVHNVALNAGAMDTDILVDSKGVTLDRPWINDGFVKLMLNEYVHLKVYNCKHFVDEINIMCALCGVKENRIENEGEIAAAVDGPKVMYKDSKIKDYLDKAVVRGLQVTIPVGEVYTQITNIESAASLAEAVHRIIKSGNKRIIIDFGMINIQRYAMVELNKELTYLASIGKDFGITIEARNVLDVDVFRQIVSIQSGFNDTVGIKKRLEIIKNTVKMNTVGILCAYNDRTKGKDELGRKGNGIAIWARPAIYRGMVMGNDSEYLAKFDVYRVDDFKTSIHKTIEDEDDNPELHPEEMLISLDKLGVYGEFTGSTYHFTLPVQYNASDSVHMRVNTGKAGGEYKKLLIPEMMMFVLNDYDIVYNEEMLMQAINETQRKIGKCE